MLFDFFLLLHKKKNHPRFLPLFLQFEECKPTTFPIFKTLEMKEYINLCFSCPFGLHLLFSLNITRFLTPPSVLSELLSKHEMYKLNISPDFCTFNHTSAPLFDQNWYFKCKAPVMHIFK